MPHETAGTQDTTVPALSRRRVIAYTVVTALLPVLLFFAAEGILRLTWPGGAIPVFVDHPALPGYLMANPHIASRWFPTEAAPPEPHRDAFAATKPANGFRVFVLGESTTAGFPYPRNVTFSRMIRDVLRDVLPLDSVEVVNLGIAATNTYAIRDVLDDVVAQRPDAVLIYAGHNEYYGALGVGSTQRLPGGDALIPLFLRLQRWRVFMAVRQGASWLRRRDADRADPAAASLMEAMARNQAIVLGDDAYLRGAEQFERNLRSIAGELRRAGIPLLIGSLSSNLKDQAPFAAAANGGAGHADDVYAAGRAALASGDTAAARDSLERARDLDVVRFRAPTEFDDIIRRIAADEDAIYVPVGEAFTAASPAGITDSTFFLEHVHPNAAGYALLARTFAEHLQRLPVVTRRRHATGQRRPWAEYARERWLTTLDQRIAAHIVQTIVQRWPFVAVDAQRDYRGSYRPSSFVDTLAFQVSRGASWEMAKLALGERLVAEGDARAAALEYRGLVRDAPAFAEPRELLGRALHSAGAASAADSAYRGAYAIRPSAANTAALGALAMERSDPASAVRFLAQSVTLEPGRADVLFRLSLAYGASGDAGRARAAGARARRIAPDLPGLAAWMDVLARMR